MTSVFISHASEDSSFAKRLANDLSAHDYSARTFRDVLPVGVRLPKDRLDRRLIAAINKDSYFIPVLSPASVASRWVDIEIETALGTEVRRGELRILPALARECLLPSKLGLRTPTDFTRSYNDGLADLLARLSAPRGSSERKRRAQGTYSSEASHLLADDLRAYLARHPDRLWDLAPQQFEELLAAVLENHGFRVELTNTTRDGGIDLIAIGGRNAQEAPILIECKRYSTGRRVGVGVVKTLYGTMARSGAKRGMIVTTSKFTSAAFQEAAALNRDNWKLDLVDMNKLISWLSRSPDLGADITLPLRQMRERHGTLVDKSFIASLSDDEQAELAKIELALDQAEQAYYEPLKEALRKERDRLAIKFSESSERSE